MSLLEQWRDLTPPRASKLRRKYKAWQRDEREAEGQLWAGSPMLRDV